MFRNEQRRVTLTPLAGSKVTVNGNAVSQTTELQHLVGVNTYANFMIRLCDIDTQTLRHFSFFLSLQDRLILGSNCTYLFIGYPSERGGDDWSRYDYDYFQSELAAAEGIHLGESQDRIDKWKKRRFIFGGNLSGIISVPVFR